MQVIRVRVERDYFAMANSTARDYANLSLEALGLLTYLLSHSDSFKITQELIQKRWKIGRDKTAKIVRELKQAGYISIAKNGFDWDWIVRGVPEKTGFPEQEKAPKQEQETFPEDEVPETGDEVPETSQVGILAGNEVPETGQVGDKDPKYIPHRIFGYWVEKTGRTRSKYNVTFQSKILARLKEGFTEQDLMLAIDGNQASDYHQARDGRNQTVYDNWELIFRNAEKVEEFIRHTEEKSNDKRSKTGSRQAQERGGEAIERKVDQLLADAERFERPNFD